MTMAPEKSAARGIVKRAMRLPFARKLRLVAVLVRTCPPAIAIEHLDVLESRPLACFERALPWPLGAAALVVVAIVGFRVIVPRFRAR